MDHKKVKSVALNYDTFIEIYSVNLSGYYFLIHNALSHHRIMLWQCELIEIIRQLENFLEPNIAQPQQDANHLNNHSSFLVRPSICQDSFTITGYSKNRGSARFRLEHDASCTLIHLHRKIFGNSWSVYEYHNCHTALADKTQFEESE